MKTKILSLIIVSMFLINLVSALTITSVSSNPSEIKPGEKVSLSLLVENNLGEDVEDVSISLILDNLPFAPYQSSNEVSYDDIKEDREKEANFLLIADSDADSGTYKIPVKMSYYLNEKEETEGVISLIINAQAEIDISVDEAILIKGKNAELTVKIVNSGLGNARLLSLKLKPTIGIRIIGSDNVYIGDIDSDDFDTAEFKVAISENAPSTINIPVELKYRDSRNNEVKESKNLEVRTYTEKQAVQLGLIKKSNTIIIVVGIIVFIVLFIIYRRIRKARKRKKEIEV